MVDFLDLILLRQSVRRYSNREVEKEKLMKCLEAARLAPSASNSQPWSFIVVDDPELKDKVAHATYTSVVGFNRFALQAPVILAIVLEHPKVITQLAIRVKHKEWSLMDIGIAAEHFCLQAAELGLGTCMLGWFKEKQVKELLGLPAAKTVGLLITLGYPSADDSLRRKKRKPLETVVTFNGYNRPHSRK
ncbi:MAG TPA: nitroreductase family protein [Bacteroidales bacterium]|nr:nitroreductase family protein [Bacteroidales bacterium]HNS46963.1 nitroreductase family protein [Bacteroidales bacterium]